MAIYNVLITENINPVDSGVATALFASQITENLVLLENPYPRGWYVINDGQTITWSSVNNNFP